MEGKRVGEEVVHLERLEPKFPHLGRGSPAAVHCVNFKKRIGSRQHNILHTRKLRVFLHLYLSRVSRIRRNVVDPIFGWEQYELYVSYIFLIYTPELVSFCHTMIVWHDPSMFLFSITIQTTRKQ